MKGMKIAGKNKLYCPKKLRLKQNLTLRLIWSWKDVAKSVSFFVPINSLSRHQDFLKVPELYNHVGNTQSTFLSDKKASVFPFKLSNNVFLDTRLNIHIGNV